MTMANSMTLLLNKIERRLGTKQLNLPEYMSKDKWAEEVICNETLDTFSRYFPNKFPYILGPQNRKGKYYLIDESICDHMTILGIQDIDWRAFSLGYPGLLYGAGSINAYDMCTTGFDVDTVIDTQMVADHVSIFSNGIYLDYIPPNKIKLNAIINSNFLPKNQEIPINLLVKHADNLMTIPPTQMETFEQLAIADVATFLYEQLKMYDNLETTFSNIDLKLASLEEKARQIDQIIEELKSSYVSASNRNQPVMLTIN
jgi:hypothetical protein